MIACLALQVLQQSKVTKAYAWLAIATSGTMIYDDYNKLAGLISFARYALALPNNTAGIMFEPMRAGFEKERGSSTVIQATKR